MVGLEFTRSAYPTESCLDPYRHSCFAPANFRVFQLLCTFDGTRLDPWKIHTVCALEDVLVDTLEDVPEDVPENAREDALEDELAHGGCARWRMRWCRRWSMSFMVIDMQRRDVQRKVTG